MAKRAAGFSPHLKVFTLIAGLILVLSLNPTTVSSAADAVRWTRVNIPAEGRAGGWALAAGSDVRHLTTAADGTLYAHCPGLADTLYKSADGGITWTSIGGVQDAIVDIAVPADTPGAIYYATTSAVYRSTDGGESFESLLPNPGGAGTGNVEITSIDIAHWDGNIIAAATRDTDGGEFGGVYTLDEKELLPRWTDTGLGGYDTYAVASSPNYAADRQLVAVITDETDTMVTTRIAEGGWGTTTGNVTLDRDNSGASVAVAGSAAIAFPDDYNADPSLGRADHFVAIDSGSGEGDVYKISYAEAPEPPSATDLNIGAAHGLDNIDVAGLASCGDMATISLLAGAADGTLTYLSADGGASWTRTRKEPSGGSATCVLVPPDFSDTGTAYAATSGDGSAFSVSRDGGQTWNQLSLLDDSLSNVSDLAPSPGYRQDDTLFMLTFGSGSSLWRSLDDGLTWERLFASDLADVDSLTLAAVPPQYGDDSRTVFLAGESSGFPAIWGSTDNGQSFRRHFTRDPVTSDPFSIDAWAVADDATLFLGGYDGSHGLVYKTTNSGYTYCQRTEAGSSWLSDIALSPDYGQDGTILVGNKNGWVYWSEDDGASFEPLPADATSPPLEGSISIAFDPDFASNRTVYAASDTADKGVFRFVIGSSDDWESTDGTLPGSAKLNALTTGGDGTLYAANSESDGGMERCLSPAGAGPTFETVTGGLGDGAILAGLWSSGHRLWSFDSANDRLLTFNDTLTSPANLTQPENMAVATGILTSHAISNVSLDWEPLEGATVYQWQCDDDNDLSSVPAGLSGNTTASSARLPALEPATTYYWRVRAIAPLLSPWSEKLSFTTSLDTETVSLRLESPQAGASGVPLKPVFQWMAVAGAEAYELLVSADADFAHPIIIKQGDYALPTTAWECDISLDYGTTYYWKVRATGESTLSAWSAAGAFTTEAPPAEAATTTPAEPPAEPTAGPPATTIILTQPAPATVTTTATATASPPPAPQTQITTTITTTPPPQTASPAIITQTESTPDWVIYTIGALVAIIILALIIVLTLVINMKRP